MSNKPIVTLLKENEFNISSLYSLYAEKIPAKKDFWERLSLEEISHATSLDNDTDIDLEKSITENKFTRGVVQYVMDFVLEEIEKTNKSNISHIDALNTALRVERSILEKKCFDMLIPTDIKVKELIQKMNAETEQHIEILEKELKKQNLLH